LGRIFHTRHTLTDLTFAQSVIHSALAHDRPTGREHDWHQRATGTVRFRLRK
jgi:hypothetical protein